MVICAGCSLMHSASRMRGAVIRLRAVFIVASVSVCAMRAVRSMATMLVVV